MARLHGAQRLVLQAIISAQADGTDFVEMARLARDTGIDQTDLNDWLQTLEEEGYIDVARTRAGLSAAVTPKGRLTLGLFRPISPPAGAGGDRTARTILFLAANPNETARLALEREVKKIEQGLERSKNRSQFTLVAKWAVTDEDLRRALLDHEPAVVHFSGHGMRGEGVGFNTGTGRDLGPGGPSADAGGLAFEDDQGRLRLISGEALCGLFELCKHHVRCVILNACHSDHQAEAIFRHIDHVIGMNTAIADDAAIKFAVGFYDALGAGKDYAVAFQFGCSAIDLGGIPGHLTPVLRSR
jgi:DNA-binding MarR family transcriptional regulator